MTTQQIALVKNTWSEMLVLEQDPGIYFYDRLFGIDPSLKALFKIDMNEQARKFIEMITYVAFKLDRFDEILQDAVDLGKRHQQYNVPTGAYKTVLLALIATLKENLGDDWNDDAEHAWKLAYGKLTHAMITGKKD